MTTKTIKLELTEQEKMTRDMVFLYEAVLDFQKNGYVENGKGATMLNDWLSELKTNAGFSGTDKQLHSLAEELTGQKL